MTTKKNNFNFDFFGNSSTSGRKASPTQVKYYYDLCRQKSVVPKTDLTNLSYEEMSSRIDELIKMKEDIPLSEKQKNLIISICERNDWVVEEKIPNLSSLTGGKGGTGEETINFLFEQEKLNRANLRPSEKQIGLIVSMYYCPDVLFSETGWVDKFEEVEGRKMLVRPSANQVAEFIYENMNRDQASNFIGKYGTVAYEWKKTRINKNQEDFIRVLEERMSNLRMGFDSKEYSPQGYEPLDELSIKLFSVEEADKHIQLLQKELKDTSLTRSEPDHRENWEVVRSKVDNSYQEMVQLIHSLYAMLGEEPTQEDLEMASYVEDVENPNFSEKIQDFKDLLKRLMESGISGELLFEKVNSCKTAAAMLSI